MKSGSGVGIHLLLVANLIKLLSGVVARFSNVAVRWESNSSGLFETAVLKCPLERPLLSPI